MSLEIFYHAVRSEINSKFHAVLAAIHFALVNMGFKCIELGEKVPLIPPNGPFSDMLPKNWNLSKNKCNLVYWNPKGTFFLMFKIFNMDSYALAHAIKEGGSSITDLDIVYDNYFGNEFGEFTGLYKKSEELLDVIEKKLIRPALPKPVQDSSKKTDKVKLPESNSSSSSDIFFDPFEKGVFRDTSSDVDPCPFCRGKNKSDTGPVLPCGRCDLDPLGRGCTCGRGGMFFDPLKNFSHPGRPQPTDPNRIPPGSVPPGARFDPIRPPVDPRNTHEPDPDEMRPPGFREHYF